MYSAHSHAHAYTTKIPNDLWRNLNPWTGNTNARRRWLPFFSYCPYFHAKNWKLRNCNDHIQKMSFSSKTNAPNTYTNNKLVSHLMLLFSCNDNYTHTTRHSHRKEYTYAYEHIVSTECKVSTVCDNIRNTQNTQIGIPRRFYFRCWTWRRSPSSRKRDLTGKEWTRAHTQVHQHNVSCNSHLSRRREYGI